jgi:hypothetical protein
VAKTKPALREDGAVANNTNSNTTATTTTAASIADHNYVADVWREALDVPNPPPSEIQDLTRGAAGTGGGGDLFRMRSSGAPVARAPPRKIVR